MFERARCVRSGFSKVPSFWPIDEYPLKPFCGPHSVFVPKFRPPPRTAVPLDYDAYIPKGFHLNSISKCSGQLGETAWQVKALTAKPEGQSLFPRTHTKEEEQGSIKLSSDLLMYTVAHVRAHTQINKCNEIKHHHMLRCWEFRSSAYEFQGDTV